MGEVENVIAKILISFLNENYAEDYTFEAFIDNSIEIYAFSKLDLSRKFSIIRIIVQNEFEQISIPNIFMPPHLEHRRVGKKLLRIIYEVGQNYYNYQVFVTQLTDSFKERLLKRGAIRTNELDMLQIVESTNLSAPLK